MPGTSEEFKVLEDLCGVHSPSGEEWVMKDFLLNYIRENQARWKIQPELIYGDGFQDCLMLRFGNPKTAAIAHMDTTGFMVRYQDQLIPIGSPEIEKSDILVGNDSLGPIECKVKIDNNYHVTYNFPRAIQTGTTLSYKKSFEEAKKYIYSPYLDDRVGIYNLLKIAETLENGLLIFSCWEEHGGGSVPFLIKHAYEKYEIRNVLISDITWITDGVHFGEGVVISVRDRNIPRRPFIDKIIKLAQINQIKYQLEVESAGSSDGREVQLSPYPIDWCFIGAPEEKAHSSREKISMEDIREMIRFYRCLFEQLA